MSDDDRAASTDYETQAAAALMRLQAGEALTDSDRLYDHYKTWCENHGRRAVSLEVFGRDLRSVLPGVKGGQRGTGPDRYRVYVGICIGETQANTCVYPSQAKNSGNGEIVARNGETHVSACVCPRCRGEGCRHCGDTGRDPARL